MSVVFGCIVAAVLGVAGAPVDVHVLLSPPEIPFYKQATLTVVVEAPANLEVKLPSLTEHLGGADVYGTPTQKTESLPDGRRRIVETYTVEAVKPGDYPIEPVQVTWPNDGSITVPAPVLRVRDLTPDEEADVARFEPIALPERPSATLSEYWPFVAAAAAAVVLVALGLMVLLRRRRSDLSLPVPFPWETAVAELRLLRTRGFIEAGDFGPYYVELTGILRRYIEARFNLHAPEQTTPEFLAEAARDGALNADHQSLLGKLLRHGDLVKFARYTPSSAEMESSFVDVQRFVEETVPRAEAAAEEAA